MMFFPYRFDLTLHRLPCLTILISLLCIVIYWQQYNSEQNYIAQTVAYCEQDRSAINHIVMNKTFGGASAQHCAKFVAKLTFAENPDELLNQYSQNSKKLWVFRLLIARNMYARFLLRNLQHINAMSAHPKPKSFGIIRIHGTK